MIVVPVDEAYPQNKKMVVTVAKSQFLKGRDIKKGVEVASQTPNGPLQGRITKAENDKVTVDFNPPIAGKELIIDVNILGVRKATAKEISGKVAPPRSTRRTRKRPAQLTRRRRSPHAARRSVDLASGPGAPSSYAAPRRWTRPR